MITVACVLRSGGIYTPDWVYKLQRGVAEHMSRPYRFVALSDMPLQCESIALERNWPGWWSKIELFRPGLFRTPVLYFDLDVMIVGQIDDLCTSAGFVMCEDFYRPTSSNSSVMSFAGGLPHIYERFLANPSKYQQIYDRQRPGGRIGDQAFIEDHAAVSIKHFLAGHVVSYKRHVRPFGDIPENARVVAFHGRPKPPDADIVRTRWRNL